VVSDRKTNASRKGNKVLFSGYDATPGFCVADCLADSHNCFILQLLEMIFSSLKRNMPTAKMGFVCSIPLYFSILPLTDF